MSTRRNYLLLAIVIFILEVLIATRMVKFDFVRGSVGDFLVVGLIYFFIQAIRPSPPRKLAIWVFIFAVAVEISQYFHLAQALHFAKGSWQYIVLGNTFSWHDILMYFLGCLAAFLIDVTLFGRR